MSCAARGCFPLPSPPPAQGRLLVAASPPIPIPSNSSQVALPKLAACSAPLVGGGPAGFLCWLLSLPRVEAVCRLTGSLLPQLRSGHVFKLPCEGRKLKSNHPTALGGGFSPWRYAFTKPSSFPSCSIQINPGPFWTMAHNLAMGMLLSLQPELPHGCVSSCFP